MADMKLALLVLLIMVTVTPITPLCDSSRPSGVPWDSKWHQSFYVYCHSGHELSRWISYYRQCQGDRLYYLGCRAGPATSSYIQHCSWTTYINAVGQTHFTGCSNDGYVTGIRSYYSSYMSDRRLELLCCRIWGYKAGQGYVQYRKNNCANTGYYSHNILDIRIPTGYTLTGVGSYYNSYYKDRRFRFQVCQMRN